MTKKKGTHLLDVDGDHCRFPLWNDDNHKRARASELIVCGEPGYPWCEKHRAVVFTKKAERESEVKARVENLMRWVV